MVSELGVLALNTHTPFHACPGSCWQASLTPVPQWKWLGGSAGDVQAHSREAGVGGWLLDHAQPLACVWG